MAIKNDPAIYRPNMDKYYRYLHISLPWIEMKPSLIMAYQNPCTSEWVRHLMRKSLFHSLLQRFAVYLIKKSMESMNTQPASTIYLIDYLAHHREYIEEVTQYKINHWLPTSPDRSYGVWFSEIEESAQKDVPPLTFVALMETGAETRELAGFVTLIEIDEQAGIEKGLWMITLYVKSEYRQQGIGKHLMQRCIMEGKRLGYPALYLWTENKELTSFYAKRGWKVISKEEESGDGIMGIKLNS